ncbi:Neurensin domain containing protein [Marine Group I thaumarchaeote SCGC RSA3]|uniref:Neurensin domain containing protein n=3 Tax=Marine Group I TaxID=905826 RepID=A0A081RNQ7_9ARCH|nr:Neurensin domain containing protein [Marine Group I thaumarchaeote SCGC AAA799-N04]KFM15210.1 Neurensin domain containing protein [Marine Group I thaumarchaeote SCGC AAA799-D11]KFM16489.1 Neurensin domain containing protein [Marine Group I thaumarchaeote SCGC RSA3]
MEIKNQTLFFVGMIILILGILIIIFDYPQLQLLDNMDSESYYMLDEEKKNIHQRMKIEITVGAGLFVAGIGLLAVSFLKRFENRFR